MWGRESRKTRTMGGSKLFYRSATTVISFIFSLLLTLKNTNLTYLMPL